jgi:acetolactate synthase-1/3 small subunit
VISKSGKRSDINLYNKLKPFGIMQFVRSGRISVSKDANITIIRRKKIKKKLDNGKLFQFITT